MSAPVDTLPDFPPRFDTPLVRPYWEALERGEIVMPHCSHCGAVQWYPYEFVRCHPDATHEWKPVPKTGTVFTFATVHRGFLPNAVPKAPPYIAALVELDGLIGARLPTLLINLGERTPQIGMRVKLAPLRRSRYTAPSFEPMP